MKQVRPQADDILIVDDEKEITNTIASILSDEGYAVRQATNGREALHAIYQQLPRLILIDNNMPILPGVATIKQLRGEGFTELSIVLMTAETVKGRELLKRELKPFGVTDILDKPFDIEQLLTIVECYWHQRQPEWRAAA